MGHFCTPIYRNDRFRELSNAEIADRQSHFPQTLERSEYASDADFLEALRSSFEKLFIPTAQTIKHAQQLVDVCSSYAAKAYKDSRDFLRQCYAENGPDRIGEIFPYCLTGPAGIGKTSFLKRLVETLPEPTSICIDSGSRAFPLKLIWYLSIEEMTSITQMLRSLITANGAEPDGKTISSLLEQCRRLAYQSGICLLVLDELQALTQSSSASDLITKTLHHFRRIGIPLVYCANYSLVHTLKRRPPQDTERLLSEPIIIIPDSAESDDWEKTVKGFVGVVPSIFKIDASNDAATLHTWTAGSKRLLSFLMRHAAKIALKKGKAVGLTELQSAYESTSFSLNRKNVEIMNLQFATGKKERTDFWCPFDLPKSEKATLKQTTVDMNVQRMTEEMIYDSMSPGQKQMYLDIVAATSEPEDSKVVPIGKNASPSIEDFERGEAILKDQK